MHDRHTEHPVEDQLVDLLVGSFAGFEISDGECLAQQQADLFIGR